MTVIYMNRTKRTRLEVKSNTYDLRSYMTQSEGKIGDSPFILT